MPTPSQPLIVHPLPQAPAFVGRQTELDALHGLWQTEMYGVLALVGLGGAGKTAVAAKFLEGLHDAKRGLRAPQGLFVWSFYQEPDAGLFLQEALRYFSGNDAALSARGAALLHLLMENLASGGPHLLVLDGLERVQRASTSADGTYGQIDDPLLKALLIRLAQGIGRTVALVTSRFPLVDLNAFRDHGYRHLDLGGLDQTAALALLHHHGVRGDDASLVNLIEDYGAHALTLDHLGSIIGQFLGGDARRAPELPALVSPSTDRQALRLARLLRAYEEHLPPEELALLCQLCLLRRSVHEDQACKLFLCSPAVHARTVRDLGGSILRVLETHDYPSSARKDLADSVQATIQEALTGAAIAGPEEVFRQEICAVASTAGQLAEEKLAGGFAELARLYARAILDAPTDLLPLPQSDRESLQTLHARYLDLREHPLMPYQSPPSALEQAFQELGHKSMGRKSDPGDTSSADVLQTHHVVRQLLSHLTVKHFALRRVRELCRLGQRKWTLAGPLAPLDATALRELLHSLVRRHLALREADGSINVHPAVRDHFSRLVAANEAEVRHDIIREQLMSLVQRPGVRLPEDTRTLDLVEEAIYHAQQAGRMDEAWSLYERVLGGHRHLAWKLGEMARGLRILKGFPTCPEPWSLAWYERALGELEEAYQHHELPCFRADVRILQGRLPEVAREDDSSRTAVAAFLMGETTKLPHEPIGSTITSGQLLLYAGRFEEARRAAQVEHYYHQIAWEGYRTRCQMVLAEAARRQGDLNGCQRQLTAASAWILHAGSVEHLCLWHLVRARMAHLAGDLDTACRGVTEGLHLAEHCGLGLYQIELLCARAELLSMSEPAAAEECAREALRRASDEACRFIWGVAEARHVLGQILATQQRFDEARELLKKTLSLRSQLGDARWQDTERLLASLPRA